jgi:hypothetical protein
MIQAMFSGMTIERVFWVYSAVLGVIVGAVLLLVPESRNLSLGPYFWVLIGIAAFEAVAVYRRGGLANGPPMTMTTRLIGFFIAVVPMLFVRLTAGI